jgi:predicted PurR-regulated permease PerM
VSIKARSEETVREGRPRPVPTVVVDENAEPVDRLRLISAWSAAVIAVIASGAVLYVMQVVLAPVVAAFVVGVILSPVAKALEERHVPRFLSAAMMVLLTALIIALVIALIADPMTQLASKAPEIGAKLHALDAPLGSWRRLETSVGINPGQAQPAVPAPSLSWVPALIGYLTPTLTGLLYFLVVLLLFISWWPDLRRQLVMTFASRESRLTVLKIVNELEASLAIYMVTIAMINLGVGAAAGIIAALTGLPSPIGFGALATTLNFIPILGPIAMFAVLAVVGVVIAPSLGLGLLPAGLFMLVMLAEGQFITPAILGRRLEINALAVLLSLMFWSWMWGPMGAFLSGPLLIVGLILREHLSPETNAA